MTDLTIVIPAYNEADTLTESLPELLDFCTGRGYQLIIVNDGSSDGTGDMLAHHAHNACFRPLHHKVNRGYGWAVKTGIRKVQTTYVITMDADGQHTLDDVDRLYKIIRERDADMVVGSRKGQSGASLYRALGKRLIRCLAGFLLPLHVYDINSGMKIYDATLARRYLPLCPDSMAYSDIITLVFISQRHLVLEAPITVGKRRAGTSSITTMTAFDTVKEILNIVVLFNPMKVFLPLALISVVGALAWGMPIALRGRGVSTGTMLGLTTGFSFFLLGLLAEQLSLLRKARLDEDRDEPA